MLFHIHAIPISARLSGKILENPQYPSLYAAFDKWKDYLNEFGFGTNLGTDFVNDLPGFIPSVSYFDRYHGKNGWKALNGYLPCNRSGRNL